MDTPAVPREGSSQARRARLGRRWVLWGSLVLLLVLLTGSLLAYFLLLAPTQREAEQHATATAAAHAYDTAIATHGAMPGFDPARSNWNPTEKVISPNNVAQLQILWSYSHPASRPSIEAVPVVANGLVYVDEREQSTSYALYDQVLLAFDASCQAQCQPLWTFQVAKGLRMVSAPAPVVANGVVYVGSSDQSLYAFSAACRMACQPLWASRTQGMLFDSPLVADGLVYVPSYSDNTLLYVFAADCRHDCQPLWTRPTTKGAGAFLSAANGQLYVASGSTLSVFPSNCRNACQPLWNLTLDGRLSTPKIANGLLYVYTSGNNGGTLYAFETYCSNSCQPLWLYHDSGAYPVISADPDLHLLYISSDRWFSTFDTTCRARCQPRRNTLLHDAVLNAPTIANGVVYIEVSVSRDKPNAPDLFAFDASCRNKCQPLWSTSLSDYIASPVTVANGVVYACSADGTIYALGLP